MGVLNNYSYYCGIKGDTSTVPCKKHDEKFTNMMARVKLYYGLRCSTLERLGEPNDVDMLEWLFMQPDDALEFTPGELVKVSITSVYSHDPIIKYGIVRDYVTSKDAGCTYRRLDRLSITTVDNTSTYDAKTVSKSDIPGEIVDIVKTQLRDQLKSACPLLGDSK